MTLADRRWARLGGGLSAAQRSPGPALGLASADGDGELTEGPIQLHDFEQELQRFVRFSRWLPAALVMGCAGVLLFAGVSLLGGLFIFGLTCLFSAALYRHGQVATKALSSLRAGTRRVMTVTIKGPRPDSESPRFDANVSDACSGDHWRLALTPMRWDISRWIDRPTQISVYFEAATGGPLILLFPDGPAWAQAFPEPAPPPPGQSPALDDHAEEPVPVAGEAPDRVTAGVVAKSPVDAGG